jgi:hypothetical protein
MGIQYLAIVEEAARGTDPGSGYLFLPVKGKLQPSFNPTDEPRKEFRGADSALGDVTVVRRESQWTYDLECSWYPGNPAIGLLFKHLFGFAGARNTVDTTAKRGILYPVPNGYAGGGDLEDLGIGIIPNTDEAGTTYSQYFGGGRVTKCAIKFEGTADVSLVFTLQGPGEYVGTPDQPELDSTPSFHAVAPLVSCDALCYVGGSPTRTGTPPDYTALAPNNAAAWRPDSLEITITNGLSDKVVMNGVRGPSHTTRESQFTVEISAPTDYDDPSSGFSSADEFKALFSGVRTNNVMVVINSPTDAGATPGAAPYGAVLDFPAVMVAAETPERNTEGKTPTVSFKFTSLYNQTTLYPMALLTTDQNAAY